MSERKHFLYAKVLACCCCFVFVFASASARQEEVSVEWGPCPYSSRFLFSLKVDCANVSGVPIDHTNAADPRRINLWVTRLTPTAAARSGDAPQVDTHLWMLQGGGGRGSLFLSQGFFGAAWQDVDVAGLFGRRVAFYLPDKRGSGLSTPLLCPSSSSSQEAFPDLKCAEALRAQWGADGLALFSETQAAYDLALLIRTLSVPMVGGRYHIYAWSHGTFLTHRFVAAVLDDASSSPSLPPPASVLLDGVVPPDICTVVDMDAMADAVGRRFLGLCGADPWCSGLPHWNGADPATAARRVLDGIRFNTTASCLARVPSAPPPSSAAALAEEFQSILAEMITDHAARQLIPAFIYRMLRCNAGDIDALDHLFAKRNESSGGGLFDAPLQFGIIASEMLLMDPDTDVYPLDRLVREEKEELVFSSHAGLTWLLDPVSRWPRYPKDAFFRKFPDYRKVPAVLVVNGNLDAETAFSQASYTARTIAMQGGAKNVRLAEVDGATHGTIFFSPVVGSNVPCTLEMLARMVTSSNPLAPNTTECLGRLAPVDWAGDTAAVKAASAEMFGTSDLWGEERR